MECMEIDHLTFNEGFNLFISLEALEHIPPLEVSGHLRYASETIQKKSLSTNKCAK